MLVHPLVAVARAHLPRLQTERGLVAKEVVSDRKAAQALWQTTFEVPEHPLHRAPQRGRARGDGGGEGEEVAPHPAARPVARLHHWLFKVRVELVECPNSDSFPRSLCLSGANLVSSCGILWAGHAFVPDASNQESHLESDIIVTTKTISS